MPFIQAHGERTEMHSRKGEMTGTQRSAGPVEGAAVGVLRHFPPPCNSKRLASAPCVGDELSPAWAPGSHGFLVLLDCDSKDGHRLQGTGCGETAGRLLRAGVGEDGEVATGDLEAEA